MHAVIAEALAIFGAEVVEVRDLGPHHRVVAPLADVLAWPVARFRARVRAVALAFDGRPVYVASGPSAFARLCESGIPRARIFTVRALESLAGPRRGETVAGLIVRSLIGGPDL